jgi:hypothetical protein
MNCNHPRLPLGLVALLLLFTALGSGTGEDE